MGFEWIPLKNYKRHYICLDCRKGFKRPSKEDMKHPENTDFSNLMEAYYASEKKGEIIAYINASYDNIKVVCPNCQASMLQVHYDFEVPPQRDTKAWKKLQERMAASLKPNYDIYIHWHRRELKNIDKNADQAKELKENLAKLERVSKG